MTDRINELPLERVRPDPDQPRKIFDEAALRELAASIRENGLLQPITVRKAGEGYVIITGERRYRAHQIAGLQTVRALVIEPKDTSDVRVLQIIENDNRVDVTPLEQARSYLALMDETGWTVDQLAARIGKAPHRVTERTNLLKLRSEYQQLIAAGSLRLSEAQEMSRLSERGQDVLFQAIRTGRCGSYNDLRAMATALVDAEKQTSFMDPVEPPTEAEKRSVRSFESMVTQVASMLNRSVRDNEIIALRKVNRDRANTLADMFKAMQSDLRRIEVALRQSAIQTDLLTNHTDAN